MLLFIAFTAISNTWRCKAMNFVLGKSSAEFWFFTRWAYICTTSITSQTETYEQSCFVMLLAAPGKDHASECTMQCNILMKRGVIRYKLWCNTPCSTLWKYFVKCTHHFFDFGIKSQSANCTLEDSGAITDYLKKLVCLSMNHKVTANNASLNKIS